MVQWLGFAFDAALLPIWLVGLLWQFLTPPRGLTRAFIPLLCVLSVAYLARYARFIPAVPDYVSYVSLATWLCLAATGALSVSLWNRRMHVAAVAVLVLLVVCAALSPPRMLARARSHERTARSIATALLASAPGAAVIVVGSDHWVAPLWYLQEIEHVRPDVVVLASGLLSSSWYFEHLFRRHPDFRRMPLQGPGGQLGRLDRLLKANSERAVLFEDPVYAGALGIPVCMHNVFAAARVACSTNREEQEQAAALWERLTARVGDGEPTSLGVLSAISYRRGLDLVAAGQREAALRTLLAPTGVGPVNFISSAQAGPLRLDVPVWQREVPLGDPARNLYAAAQLALASGATKAGLALMLKARASGLREAESWLAAWPSRPIAPSPP